jgi:hypothetical protein
MPITSNNIWPIYFFVKLKMVRTREGPLKSGFVIFIFIFGEVSCFGKGFHLRDMLLRIEFCVDQKY